MLGTQQADLGRFPFRALPGDRFIARLVAQCLECQQQARTRTHLLHGLALRHVRQKLRLRQQGLVAGMDRLALLQRRVECEPRGRNSQNQRGCEPGQRPAHDKPRLLRLAFLCGRLFLERGATRSLGLGDLLQALRLRALAPRFLLLAGAEKIEVQCGQGRRLLGPARRPGPGRIDIAAGE